MLMHMSISGGILIILILALRMLAVKRLPKKSICVVVGDCRIAIVDPF